MMPYIQYDFPIEALTPLAKREANAKRPIAQLHKWFARRLGSVFRTIVLTTFIPKDEWEALDAKMKRQNSNAWKALYYEATSEAKSLIEKYCKGKVVLDPFMGGGTTLVESLRFGCRAIGVDVNPVAWFIVKKSLEPIPPEQLDEAFKKLEKTVAPEITKFYKTKCPHGNHLADVMYVFWVKKLICQSCGQPTRLFNSFRLAVKNSQNRKTKSSVNEVNIIFCPSCYTVDGCSNMDAEFSCRACGRQFVPGEGFKHGRKFFCENPSCGQAVNVTDYVKQTGKAPDREMFAIEYWCPKCNQRGYKGAEDFDRQLYEASCAEFERERNSLPIPDQLIPTEGRRDQRPVSYGIRTFAEIFNPRQLLGLGRLLKAIQQIEDNMLKEMLIITLSDCINANNELCTYNVQGSKLEPLFGATYFAVPDDFVENNIWGTKFGRGTFQSYVRKTRRALEWAITPTEPPIEGNSYIHVGRGLHDLKSGMPNEAISGIADFAVECRTSRDLSFIPPNSLDAVITDPPYYDLINYGEIADFFYVWLHAGLGSNYPNFGSHVIDRTPEIEENRSASNKTAADYVRGLTAVFTECNRRLKPTGTMSFTFHHATARAWAAVVEAVMKSGFDIASVWPIHSETRSGVRAGGIKFDTIVVCAKRSGEPQEIAWQSLQDEIVESVQAEFQRLLSNGAALSPEDVFVITMGKALSLYSRHWPKVMQRGVEVKLAKAVEDIEKLVDEQFDAYLGMVVPHWLDTIPRAYVQFLARKTVVSRDDLVKTLRPRGIEVDTLENLAYIKRTGKSGMFKVLSPAERKSTIERWIESGTELNPVDRAHYLYALRKQSTSSVRLVVARLYVDGLEDVCRALYQITRDSLYHDLAEKDIPRYKQQQLL
jgi:adenine-specific DNA methylase